MFYKYNFSINTTNENTTENKNTNAITSSNACCSLCGCDMGFEDDGGEYYCFTPYTCEAGDL